jgi:signal transduction histidine kinase
VILAQAESAQYLDEVDTQGLKRTMANIAESARSSLREVRAVLASPDGTAARAVDLDALIDSTRASGQDISVVDVGAPRPLPPEIATVAFRVLQELLTNAIKHGRRDATITVVRDWHDELRLTVSNPVDELSLGEDGNGLEGMRRRLESVGGSLEAAAVSADGTTFTARAVIPVRAARSLP